MEEDNYGKLKSNLMSLLPVINVIDGQPRSGKTAYALEQLSHCTNGGFIIYPDDTTAKHVRFRHQLHFQIEELVTVLSQRDFIYTLADYEILKGSVLSNAIQRQVIRDCVKARFNEGSYFERVSHTPGFNRHVVDFVRSTRDIGLSSSLLKNNIETLATTADDPSLRIRMHELATVLADYEAFLDENEVLDHASLFNIAIQKIEAGTDLPLTFDTLIFDGYSHLDAQTLRFLRALGNRCIHLFLTLTSDPSRPELFAQSIKTIELLKQHFSVDKIAVIPNPSTLTNSYSSTLFSKSKIDLEQIPFPKTTIIDAPNTYIEVENVVRQLCKAHLEKEVNWNSILIIARSTQYRELLTTVCARYEVPLRFSMGTRFDQDNDFKTILSLLRLPIDGWQREPVLKLIKKIESTLTILELDQIRRIARDHGVKKLKADWIELSSLLPQNISDALELLSETAETLDRGEVSFSDHANEFRSALKTLNLDTGVNPSVPIALTALEGLSRYSRLVGSKPVPYYEFVASLETAWSQITLPPPTFAQSISVLEPGELNQIETEIVAILGLTDKDFPRRVIEDPLFRDTERTHLNTLLGNLMPLSSDQTNSDKLNFFFTVCAANSQLILSYPRTAHDSEQSRSHFLDEVERCNPDINKVIKSLSEVIPTESECVNDHEKERLSANSSTIELLPERPLSVGTSSMSNFANMHLSPTVLETYDRCPFKWFMRFGLKLKSETPRNGKALLERLYRKIVWDLNTETLAFNADIISKLVSAEIVKSHPEMAGYQVDLLQSALESLITGYVERESLYSKQFGSAILHRNLRYDRDTPLTLSQEDSGSPIPVRGVVQRIDSIAGHSCIAVCYSQYSKPPEWSEVILGRDLRVVSDVMAIEQIWGMSVGAIIYDSATAPNRKRFIRRDKLSSEAFKRYLPIKHVESGPIVKSLSTDDWIEAVNVFRIKVTESAHRIAKGIIIPTPGEHCRKCNYSSHCRTNTFGKHDGA